MTQAPTSTSGLVRVTVASGTRRVDLVLPGAVPVAELLPELARSVGLLDPATVYGGYRVVTAEGRELASDAGLTIQGIEDGGLLTVSAGVDDEPPRVYDDVVEAMTDVVERDLKPWEPASGRRTALAAAGLLMALGAVALLIQRGSLLAGVAAAVVATALVAGAIVLSRAQREPEAAVAVAWMAAAYAAVAGLMLVTDDYLFGLPMAAAGGGALLAGLVALVGLGEGRTLVTPPVVVGAILLATGLVMNGVDVDHRVVLTTTLVLVVLVGSIFPWLALGATATRVDQLYTVADITADPDEIDPERVQADARVAHEILLGISSTVGLLLVIIAPLAVALGLSGALLAVVACLVVMLRTRQYRTGSEVLVGLVSGITGLVSVGVAILWLHPDWRPGAAVALAATGAVLLAVTLLPGTPSLRRGRLGDLAESICLLTLLPLTVVATGVFSAIRG
ncbi:type VII secretion integral membrane protein EccD [Nocardioides marmotae]|uniref:Type VII secretion integral membrane protein EccD n=1 Tax=Nocardioides marmotae TaxID=2663857 RepID=A0A6I3JD83_9ACTN|nr:type VII secretion integral membrane protein EccD [Nocardioides marmotae]MCR6032465.1 type VII secretion integral membrane protein EccD [Gordonia jinghuaiqii]MBC9734244.1 type VII secretion integral membrane protein EccD [Nocardioides marmotae]MTB85346.1 type VII secretion integral membrane protein EccD [Nocardioides marmotae]MTB96114.1 type VII secretion integral membrane protein EccD [Nocardioides marmotae]QKD99807.1 type VII secretion integral membrane protein EccD [Nocardioides marmotae